jgi:hypothetical protein
MYLFKNCTAFVLSKKRRHVSVLVQNVHIAANFFRETVRTPEKSPEGSFFVYFHCELNCHSERFFKKHILGSTASPLGTVPTSFFPCSTFKKVEILRYSTNLKLLPLQKPKMLIMKK